MVDVGNQYCLRNNKEALKFIKTSPIISKDKVLSRVKNRRENLDKRIIDIYRDHDLKDFYFEDFLDIDYWYNFCIWDEKVRMDSRSLYWRNAVGSNITLDDFGSVYIAIKNKHPDITAVMKLWFLHYTQYWIYYRKYNIKGIRSILWCKWA